MSEVQRTKLRIQKELKTKNPPPLFFCGGG